MSSTLLRLGLWTVITVVVLYVLHETFAEAPLIDSIPTSLLQKSLVIGGLLVVAGVVMGILEKGASKVKKNRCSICKTPVPPGAIYCREHLRNVLSREDERTHHTRSHKL